MLDVAKTKLSLAPMSQVLLADTNLGKKLNVLKIAGPDRYDFMSKNEE